MGSWLLSLFSYLSFLNLLLLSSGSKTICSDQQENSCISLCCPYKHIWAKDENWEQPRCKEYMQPAYTCTPDIAYENVDVWKGMPSFLRGLNEPFTCPKGASLVSVEDAYMNFSVSSVGKLIASYPGVVDTFNNSMFCILYKQEPKGLLSKAYRVCLQQSEKEGEDFTTIFYSLALLISLLFLLLTLLVYLISPDLHKPLFGKIILGFIINNCVAYVSAIIKNLTKNTLKVNSRPCILLGYVILYAFVCLFLWINAMAANIFFKFTSLASSSRNNSSKFKYYVLYVQGLPLLFCSAVALIDNYGPCDWTLPEMGAAQCFLGSPWESQWNGSSLFSNSEFIYFQSIMLLLQSVNIILFLITLSHFIKHWTLAGKVLQVENRGNFSIVIKLFIIMGIPWLGDFLSHMVTLGPASNMWLRFALDLMNLFSGVLVFLVLVCKAQLMQRLVNKLHRNEQYLPTETTLTTRSSVKGDLDRSVRQDLLNSGC